MTRITLAALAALLANPVLAQSVIVTTPTPLAPATPPIAAVPTIVYVPAISTDPRDSEYLSHIARGTLYERQIAALALQNSRRDDIRAYATLLIADHDAYTRALVDLAALKGIELPTTMTRDDQVRLNSMTNQTTSVADGSFVEEAIRVNAEDRRLAAEAAARTPDPDVRAFLVRFEPVDAVHERMALTLRR